MLPIKKCWIVTVFVALLMALPSAATADKLRVVAATADLGYFAHQIGGDLVDVDVIAAGNRDLHYVEVLPSYMLKLRRADVYLKLGLELDVWSQSLIDGSRNSDLIVTDCSAGINALEVPTFKADARYGDLHRYGNPHYWLSPENVPTICANITDALTAADPEHADAYESGRDGYLARLKSKMNEWDADKGAMGNVEFIGYHNTWPYFCEFFGCHTVAFVEEYPGVTPSPSHLTKLLERIRQEQIPAVAYEPFHDKRTPEWLAGKSGCRTVVLTESVGGLPGTETYEKLIDTLVARLTSVAQVVE